MGCDDCDCNDDTDSNLPGPLCCWPMGQDQAKQAQGPTTEELKWAKESKGGGKDGMRGGGEGTGGVEGRGWGGRTGVPEALLVVGGLLEGLKKVKGCRRHVRQQRRWAQGGAGWKRGGG